MNQTSSILIDLQDVITAVKDLQAKLDAANEKVAALEKENAELKADLADACDNLQRACKAIDRRYDEIDALKKELREVKEDAKYMHDRFDRGEVKTLNRLYGNLYSYSQEGREERHKEARKIVEQLDDYQTTSNLRDLVQAISAARWFATKGMGFDETPYERRLRREIDTSNLVELAWDLISYKFRD